MRSHVEAFCPLCMNCNSHLLDLIILSFPGQCDVHPAQTSTLVSYFVLKLQLKKKLNQFFDNCFDFVMDYGDSA